jgi:acetoin utilization deacetylase AcuC-like enzyme
MVPVYYSPSYYAAAFAFPTTRKAKWIAESLGDDPIAGVSLQPPHPLTEDQLLQTHDADYVCAIKTGDPRDLAQAQEHKWDSGLWAMVLASNGGVVAAALHALRGGIAGSLSSGLHHARRDRGCGYCTFNGLVVAAKAALDAGVGRVLILDLDAHGGDSANARHSSSGFAFIPRAWTPMRIARTAPWRESTIGCSRSGSGSCLPGVSAAGCPLPS